MLKRLKKKKKLNKLRPSHKKQLKIVNNRMLNNNNLLKAKNNQKIPLNLNLHQIRPKNPKRKERLEQEQSLKQSNSTKTNPKSIF